MYLLHLRPLFVELPIFVLDGLVLLEPGRVALRRHRPRGHYAPRQRLEHAVLSRADAGKRKCFHGRS